MKRYWPQVFLFCAGIVFAALGRPARTVAGSSSAAKLANESVRVQRTGFRVKVSIGGKPFTIYYFDPKMAKPYFQPLRSAQGTIVTRSFPIGDEVPPAHAHDPNLEPHQRPMYFAHGDIDGVDFWAEQTFSRFYDAHPMPYGRTVFLKLDRVHSGSQFGALKAEFNLEAPGGKILGEETQEYAFTGNQDQRIIDCTFVIRANHGPIHMNDSKEGTFAIRVAPDLNSPPGHMVDSLGRLGESGIWGKRADWVDYYGRVNGEEVGIAIFDSPSSFRHPTYWHARGYGLFAANPFGISYFTHDKSRNGSYLIPAGGSLTFHYRVLTHHGDYKQAHVAEAYRRYAAGE
jgi:Family of unknown function (DUF6807)